MSAGRREQLREALRKLAAEPSRSSPHRLWRALTPGERETGLLEALHRNGEPPADVIDVLAQHVAEERHFRPKTVQQWPHAKLAKAAAQCALDDGLVIVQALIGLCVGARKRVLTQFFDAAGVPHEDGAFDEAALPTPAAPDEQLAAAASDTAAQHSLDEMVVLALFLLIAFPEQFQGLAQWLEGRFGDGVDTEPVHAPPVIGSESDRTPPPLSVVTDAFGFTTLDRRLIRTVVDTAHGVTGAASEDELDDLILELIQLNSVRHETFFHAGFRDALLKRSLGGDIPAENENRRAWYWAGVVAGIARTSDWNRVVDLHDKEPAVRTIGQSGNGAASAVASTVFRALCAVERYSEASAFVNVDVALHSVDLRNELLETATRLLREGRAADASPMLEHLWQIYLLTQERGGDLDTPFFAELRRRRALCFHQLGHDAAARELLGEHVKHPDPVSRAIALTDLGLLNTGLRRLGDFRLPDEESDVAGWLERRSPGEPLLLEAVGNPLFRPAHAQFALGVIALARREWDAACHRLEEARAFFLRRPDVYRRDGTLQLTQLYLGVATCLALRDETKIARACEDICAALDSGFHVPQYLLVQMVEIVALAAPKRVAEVVAAIVRRAGEAELNLLASAPEPVCSLPAVITAQFDRATAPGRSIRDRATAYRSLLPALLRRGEIERAGQALAFLEAAATDGVGREELLAILRDHDSYSPAWDEDRVLEAKVRILQSEGRYEEATIALEEAVHRILATSDSHAIYEAELLLLQLESYGPVATEAIARLRPRIEACAPVAEESPDFALPPVPSVEVRILIVGGNEVQARMEQDIREAVKESQCGVTLKFLRTGWSANWGDLAREFDRRVVNADGVVFLYLMRTMLGRAVRRSCPVPWMGCGRKGRGAIEQTILKLVPLAQEHALKHAPQC